MKKLILLLMCVMLITGCGKRETNSQDLVKNDIVDKLTKEQYNYLTKEMYYTKEALEYMSYEAINFQLLGTGMELYNQTSGVEKNGIDYEAKNDFDISSIKSNTEKKITYDEAKEIRLKDTEIRIEDFLDYNFEIKAKTESGSYQMKLPIDGYVDTYVKFNIKIDGEKIHLSTPHIACKSSVFSILYDSLQFENFVKNGDYSNENKLLIGLQYNSITPESLVLKIINDTKKEYKFNGNVKIYEGSDTSKLPIVDTKENGEIVVKTKTFSNIPISFGKKLKPGIYTFEYGNRDFSTVIEIF